ncbi:MAG: zf-TFIIB domain-containing protein [Pseudomonadota bacterium]
MRQGIEIDYCPQCRGVWLDRGELDKIIERSAMLVDAGVSMDRKATIEGSYQSHKPEHRHHRVDYDDDHRDDYHRNKKRRGFLGDLFDFD